MTLGSAATNFAQAITSSRGSRGLTRMVLSHGCNQLDTDRIPEIRKEHRTYAGSGHVPTKIAEGADPEIPLTSSARTSGWRHRSGKNTMRTCRVFPHRCASSSCSFRMLPAYRRLKTSAASRPSFVKTTCPPAVKISPRFTARPIAVDACVGDQRNAALM